MKFFTLEKPHIVFFRDLFPSFVGMESTPKEKRSFLFRNLLRGFLFLIVLIAIFLLFEKVFSEAQREVWFGQIYDNPLLVISVFVGSEILFGIIPPEVFMLWTLRTEHMGGYLFSLGLLSIISYAAGVLNFSIGYWIKNKKILVRLDHPWIHKYMILFEKYGSYLVIVASISPLPFSAIALLSGAGNLHPRKYLLFSLLRILRFFV